MVQHAKEGKSSFSTRTISPFSNLKLQRNYNPLKIELKFPKHRYSLFDTKEVLEQWLVHIKPPMTPAFRQSLEDLLAPYKLGDYIPQNSYIVVCPRSVAHRLLSLPGVLVVIEFHPTFKVDPLLLSTPLALTNGTSQNKKNILRVRLALKSPDHAALTDSTSQSLTETLYASVNDYKSLHSNDGEELGWMSDIKISSSAKDLMAVSYEELEGAPSTRRDHVLKWLSSVSVVHWIEQHRPVKLQNKFARYVVQSDVPSQFDIWAHGVSGEGQVVAVGDTGVDYDHCLFWDPHHDVPLNTVNHNHRKIVTYATLMDERTQRYGPAGDSEGHGTHTAGSICGDSLYSQDPGAEEYMRNYNGMAYKAKLAVYDYQDVSSQDIYLPLSIYEEFFTPSYNNAGARLSSNSWGDENGQYDIYAEDTDRFAWDHPEMCIIFAAGNYGDNGFHSVASPGIAKNCLSIGSSLNAPDSFGAIGYSAGISVVAPSALEGVYLVVPADFGPRFSTLRQVVGASLVLADPSTGCSSLNNADDVDGNIVVIRRGQCEFSAKALNAQAAGAILMIVVNNDDATVNMEISDDIDPERFTMPAVMISKQEGNRLFVDSDLSAVRLTYPVPYTSSERTESRLSDFSSRGPTWDGRLKPDFCAPGDFIQSAKSDNNLDTYQCPKDGSGIVKMQGTSMAAPIAAGAAALVRHYFEGGFYKPLGAFHPTSALVKAVMANSGKELSGQVFASPIHHRAKINVTSIPSFFQGYGRIKLDDVLYFNDSVGASDFALYVWDAKSIALHDHHSYCFTVKEGSSSSRPLKVTLAWIDYPALPTSSQMLTNNLDLAVVDVQRETTYLGNQGGDYPVYLWDDLNNMEQVMVKQPAVGDAFLVQVLGTQIPQPKNGGQPYSLVVTGPVGLQSADLSLCGSNAHDVICPTDCNLHGRCNLDTGRCECQPHYAGASCSIPMLRLNTSSPSTGKVEPNSWIYYSFDVLPVHSNLKFYITTSGAGDPDFYITKPRSTEVHGYDGYPTLAFHDYANTECDSCGKTSHMIVIPDSDLTTGSYSLGVYGYCCEPSSFSITVSVTLEGALRVSLFTTDSTENQSFDNFTTDLAAVLNVSATRLQLNQAQTQNHVIVFYLLPALPLIGTNDDTTTTQLLDKLSAALASSNKDIQNTAPNSTEEQSAWEKFVAKWSIDAAQPPVFVRVKMSYSDGVWEEDLDEDAPSTSKMAIWSIVIPAFVGVLSCTALVCWLRRRNQHPKTKKSDKGTFVNLPEDSTLEQMPDEEDDQQQGLEGTNSSQHPGQTRLTTTNITAADFKRPPLQTPERPKPADSYRLDSPPSPSPTPTPSKPVPETPDSAKKEMMEVLHGISETIRPRNLAGQAFEGPVPREKDGLIENEGV